MGQRLLYFSALLLKIIRGGACFCCQKVSLTPKDKGNLGLKEKASRSCGISDSCRQQKGNYILVTPKAFPVIESEDPGTEQKIVFCLGRL